MATVPILVISQRTEDSKISIDTQIPNPLMVVDLLLTAAKSYVAQAGATMELKPQSAIITGEQGKSLIT